MTRELRVSLWSVIVIIVLVAAVALIGSYFSGMNRDWYESLQKPTWQPPDWVFPVVWNTIFVLAIVALTLIWNTRPRSRVTYWTMATAALNGLLNVVWSVLFFGNRLISPAVYEAGLLCLSVVLIMILAWPISKVGSLLFLPYALWTAFATYLTATILRLNPHG